MRYPEEGIGQCTVYFNKPSHNAALGLETGITNEK